MRFGILGTGAVGAAMARKLATLDHSVMLGSRTPGSDKAGELARAHNIAVGTYVQAAEHGQLLINALPGEHAIDILKTCRVGDKILIDIGNYDSAVDQPIVLPLGQAIQTAFPRLRVVKTLNSVSAHLMVDPASLGAAQHVFIASNDADAKAEVTALLRTFGWQDILDLGDLSACRAMEQLIPLWMGLEAAFGDPDFGLAVVRRSAS